MRIELKHSLSKNKILLILSVASVLLGVASVLLGVINCALGEILLPFLVGSLSVLYVLNRATKSNYGFWVSVIILGINIAALYYGFVASLFGLAAIILSKMLSVGFEKNKCKADTAYLMMIIYGGFTVLCFIGFAMVMQNVYTMDAVTAFYTDLIEYVRAVIVTAIMLFFSFVETQTQTPTGITEDMVVALINQEMANVIAYILLIGFAGVGIAMKLFGFILSKCSENNKPVREWRFITTGFHGYFYLIVSIAMVFITDTSTLFAVTVFNLNKLFMFVFAYVGFNFMLSLMRRRMKRWLSFMLLVLAIIVTGRLAIQVLALLGVLFTIRKSKEAGFKKS